MGGPVRYPDRDRSRGLRSRRRERLEKGHPEEPWLWRDDWAAGRVKDAHPSRAAGLWALALMWNLIALPGAFFGVGEALITGKPGGWAGLLFPLVGVGLIAAATRAMPAAIGRGLGGVIRTPADVRPADGFTLVLSCMRVVRSVAPVDRRMTS